jgi:thioredoxin
MLLDRPVKVNEDDFDRTVLGAGVPVLVDFYADWCAPCKMVAPVVDDIARQRMGELLVVKVDTDFAPGLARRYGIRGIPTVVLFDGGTEVARSVGFEPDRLWQMVRRAE